MRRMTLVLAVMAVALLATAGPASAQEYPLRPPTVADESIERSTPPAPGEVTPAAEVRALPEAVLSEAVVAPAAGPATEVRGGAGLALTGGDIVGLVALALALGALGTLLVRTVRRPTPA